MDFDLTQDQQLLVDTVASFVKKESPVSRMRALRDDPIGWSKQTWKKMGELGWLGILFPEDVGGSGGTFVDLSLVLEQFGTALVPEPLVPSVLAGMAIARAGTDLQRKRWLEPLVSGDTSLALGWAEHGSRFEPTRVATRAQRRGDGYVLTGSKVFVANGHAADALVVSARTSGAEGDRDGISLFVVDAKAPGVRVRPITTMDGQRAAAVALEGPFVGADGLIGAEGGAAALLELLMDLGAAAACAEGVGLMRTVLRMTTDYLCTREQFGVKIGTFQAFQHRAVDMFIETELARSTSIMASIKADEADEVERKAAISAAKSQLAVSGRYVTQQAIQLHGGIGVTDEHDVGLYFKRMHTLATSFGDDEHHVARFSSLPSFVAGLEQA